MPSVHHISHFRFWNSIQIWKYLLKNHISAPQVMPKANIGAITNLESGEIFPTTSNMLWKAYALWSTYCPQCRFGQDNLSSRYYFKAQHTFQVPKLFQAFPQKKNQVSYKNKRWETINRSHVLLPTVKPARCCPALHKILPCHCSYELLTQCLHHYHQ